MPNPYYAPHANPTHSTADEHVPTNRLNCQNYKCVSDVVPAPELVDVSGGNLSTNNFVLIEYMINIRNMLPPSMALAALEPTFSENKKNECLESCYSHGYRQTLPIHSGNN